MEPSLIPYQHWFEKHEQAILKNYFKFLSFPSISAHSTFKEEILSTARWLCSYLESIGMKRVELWETSGHPVVFASHLTGGVNRPTLLLYHHYDVQPVDPIELWTSPPFEPELREGQVYARGALDNKGQCFYSLTALKAYLELADKEGINLKIFIEGEEESRGEGTFGILSKKKEELKADYLLIVDLRIPSLERPALTLGVRGLTSFEIEYKNGYGDLHSGNHGGIALNPNRVLVDCLHSLWDEEGRVAVPGFYDQVRPLTEKERALLDFTFDQEEYEKNFDIKAFSAEPGFSLLESNWIRPSLEVNGMSGGYVGEGLKTIIPSIAKAKISCRLVPDQDPYETAHKIIDFLKSKTPPHITMNATIHQGAAKAYRSPYPCRLVDLTKEAFEVVFKKPCSHILSGASIPITQALTEVSGADTVMMGLGLPTDQVHAPNEHFGWDRFRLGFLIMAKIFLKMSKEIYE